MWGSATPCSVIIFVRQFREKLRNVLEIDGGKTIQKADFRKLPCSYDETPRNITICSQPVLK